MKKREIMCHTFGDETRKLRQMTTRKLYQWVKQIGLDPFLWGKLRVTLENILKISHRFAQFVIEENKIMLQEAREESHEQEI